MPPAIAESKPPPPPPINFPIAETNCCIAVGAVVLAPVGNLEG
jgi:hypothetical protein